MGKWTVQGICGPLRRTSHFGFSRDALVAPLCVKGVAFPPVDGAPVLAAVKQTALDCGCGSALGQGVGNAAKKGLGQRKLAA